MHLAGLPLPRANATPGPKGASSGKREPTVDMLPPGSGALLGSLMGVSGTAVGLDPQEADFEAEERALQQPGLSDRPLPHLAREPCSDTWKLQCPVTLGHRTELRRGSPRCPDRFAALEDVVLGTCRVSGSRAEAVWGFHRRNIQIVVQSLRDRKSVV